MLASPLISHTWSKSPLAQVFLAESLICETASVMPFPFLA